MRCVHEDALRSWAGHEWLPGCSTKRTPGRHIDGTVQIHPSADSPEGSTNGDASTEGPKRHTNNIMPPTSLHQPSQHQSVKLAPQLQHVLLQLVQVLLHRQHLAHQPLTSRGPQPRLQLCLTRVVSQVSLGTWA